MSDQIYLSIVIPAYNESNRIGKTIALINEYLTQQPYRYEIIIVDDGSSDDTIKIVQSSIKYLAHFRLVDYTPNRGKGYAVKTGMLTATGKYILFTDTDLSTPIEEVERFISIMESGNYQMVIGSRGLPESEILKHQPWFREKMGGIFNRFVHLLVFPGINDTQCGFKLFRTEIISPLFTNQTIDRFSFDVEILYLAQKLEYRIKEEPVRWTNSLATKVNPFTDATRMLFDLIKIKWRHRKV